jgi:molybdenum cofactor cytidylyltransferase
VKLLWCNAAKTLTLCFKIRDQVMNRLPTLLVLANTSANVRQKEQFCPEKRAPHLSDSLHDTLSKGLKSGLPVLFVAPRDIAERACTLLPANCVVELTDSHPIFGSASNAPDNFVKAVVAGVLASAQANGWLILPGGTPLLRANTLRRIADAPAHQSVVVPQYKQLQGHPMRFSPEFFSELIRLQSVRDLNRLISRYPVMGLEVDDPGVLMTNYAQPTLSAPTLSALATMCIQ